MGNGEYGNGSEPTVEKLALSEEEKHEIENLEEQWNSLLETNKEIHKALEDQYGKAPWSEYQKKIVEMRTITERLETIRSQMDRLRDKHSEKAEREGKATSI